MIFVVRHCPGTHRRIPLIASLEVRKFLIVMSPPLIAALIIEADDKVGIDIGLPEGTTKQKVARLVIDLNVEDLSPAANYNDLIRAVPSEVNTTTMHVVKILVQDTFGEHGASG